MIPLSNHAPEIFYLVSFIPAINDLTSDLHKVESRNRELELELTTFREKLTKALVLEKRLQE